MRIINRSGHPTHTVRQLVEYGLGQNLRGAPTIVVSRTGKNAGSGELVLVQRRGPDQAARIRLRVGAPSQFPASNTTQRGLSPRSPRITLRNWREAIVAVAAHEAIHLRQLRRHHGAQPYAESTADQYSARRLAAYRRLHNA